MGAGRLVVRARQGDVRASGDEVDAEGLADPTEFVRDLDGFSDAEIEQVMRGNALALSQRRPA